MMLALSMLVSIAVSRTLGVDGRGAVSWMLAYSGFGMTFAVMGMGQASKKYIAKMPVHTPVFIVLDGIVLSASLVIFLPLLYWYGASSPLGQRHPHIFLIALLLVPCLAFSSLINDLLIGLGKSLHYNLLTVIEKCSNLVMALSLIALKRITPLTVVIIFTLSVWCRLGAGIRYIKPHVTHLPSRLELHDAFRLMRGLIFSAYFCNLAMYYSGIAVTIVLGFASSSQDLGDFSIVKLLTDAAQIVPVALANYSLPMLSQESSRGKFAREKLHLIMLTIVTMLVIALPFFLFSQTIVSVLFGTGFISAAPCLRIMAIGLAASGVLMVIQSIIASQHQEWLLMVSSGFLALCVTLFTAFAYHDMSAVTAAYVYAASYTLGMAFSLLMVFL
ncbi:MAG: hypothetical protein KGI29_07305 [Pseudomonadota bacterium]|nr:hypothetical protein [Pseudomonadota bacterium]